MTDTPKPQEVKAPPPAPPRPQLGWWARRKKARAEKLAAAAKAREEAFLQSARGQELIRQRGDLVAVNTVRHFFKSEGITTCAMCLCRQQLRGRQVIVGMEQDRRGNQVPKVGKVMLCPAHFAAFQAPQPSKDAQDTAQVQAVHPEVQSV